MPVSRHASTAQTRRRQSARGKFENGVWYCACEPPLQAAHLQVRKEGNTKGRWFYTCAKPRQSQCGFFLFDNEANAIEKNPPERSSPFAIAGLNNEETARRANTPLSDAASTIAATGPVYSPASSVFPTPASRQQRIFRGIPRKPDSSWDSSGDDSDAVTDNPHQPSVTKPPPVSAPTLKRQRPEAEEAETEQRTPDLSDLDSDDARLLAELADRSERLHHEGQRCGRSDASGPTTPNPRGTGMRASNAQGGLPTPSSKNSLSSARHQHQHRQTPGGTFPPANKRLKTAATPAAATARGGNHSTARKDEGDHDADDDNDAEITRSILGLLQTEPVSPPARRAIREALNLHALKARGVERARDMLREGIKAKEGRIAELQARVAQLERERRARAAALRRAVGDLQGLFSCHDDGDDVEEEEVEGGEA